MRLASINQLHCAQRAHTVGDDGTRLGGHLELHGTSSSHLCPDLITALRAGHRVETGGKSGARTSSAANFRTAVNGAASGTLNLLRMTGHTP